MGNIFYLLGKSASGKDSIYRKLMENKKLNLHPVVMYTTRPMRNGETEGVEYHFINDEKFYLLKEEGKLIEYREYQTIHGVWRYMTVNDGQIKLKNCSFLMIGTLESYVNMVKYFGKDVLVPIYIELDDGIRLIRAVNREKNQIEPRYAELCRRFLADEEDFSKDKLEAAGIEKKYCNEDFEECVNQIISTISEKQKVEDVFS